MKHNKFFLIAIIISIALLLPSCSFESKDDDYEWEFENYKHYLFDDYYYERQSSLEGSIYKNGVEQYFIDYTFCYAHDDERYIAMHIMTLSEEDEFDNGYIRIINGNKFYATDDRFILLDTQVDNMHKAAQDFESKGQLINYCESNNIELSNWFYPAAATEFESESVKLNDTLYLENIGGRRGVSIYDMNDELFHGLIDEYAVGNNDYIGFHMVIADTGYDGENLSSYNKSLSDIPTQAFDQINFGLLDRYPVYYDQYVLYCSETAETFEFDTKDQLEQYTKQQGISFDKWIDIEL